MTEPSATRPPLPSPPPPPPPGRSRRRRRRPESVVLLAILVLSAVIIWQGADWFSRWYAPPPSRHEPPFIIWLFSAEAEAIALPLAQFRHDHPEAEIVVRKFEWDFPLLEEMPFHTGDEQPSLIQMGTTWMPAAARQGLLLPLDAMLDRSSIDTEIFLSEAWRTCSYDSRVYGVPWYVENRCLFYRTDILPKAPARWDDLRKWRDAIAPSKPILLPYGEWSVFGIFLFQSDADPLKPLSPEFGFALDRYLELFKDGTTIFGDTFAETRQLDAFAEGRIASFVGGPWFIPLIEKNSPQLHDSWAVVPLPALDKRTTSFLGGSNWVVPANAPKPELAWAFIQQMSTPGAQAEWHEISGDLPSVKKAWTFPAVRNDTWSAPFIRQMSDVRSAPLTPDWARLERRFGDVLAWIIKGKTSPEQGRAELASEIDSTTAPAATPH